MKLSAEEPDDVDANGGRDRTKGRVAVSRRRRRTRTKPGTWVVEVEVVPLSETEDSCLGYLVHEEDGHDSGIGEQLLVALDDEHCHCNSKETGLSTKVRVQGKGR